MAQILDTPPTEKFIFPLLESGLVCDKYDYHAKKTILVIWRDHVEREVQMSPPFIRYVSEPFRCYRLTCHLAAVK